MRTTLSIDSDVFRVAKQLAAAQSKSLGSVISDLARKGLNGPKSEPRTRNGFPVFNVPPDIEPFSLDDVKREDDEW